MIENTKTRKKERERERKREREGERESERKIYRIKIKDEEVAMKLTREKRRPGTQGQTVRRNDQE